MRLEVQPLQRRQHLGVEPFRESLRGGGHWRSGGNIFNQPGDDLTGRLALGIRLKGANQPVAQDQRRDGRHVLTSDVEAALAGGPGAAKKYQVLAGARAGAPSNPPLDVP